MATRSPPSARSNERVRVRGHDDERKRGAEPEPGRLRDSSATTSVTPGTRSMMMRSTPALRVIIDTGQVPHAPISDTCTTPSGSTPW